MFEKGPEEYFTGQFPTRQNDREMLQAGNYLSCQGLGPFLQFHRKVAGTDIYNPRANSVCVS